MSKRALCIGINDYPGTGSDLSGCVNDAADWRDALTARGFAVTTLLDKAATLDAMAAGMRDVVRATKPGEIAIITFSGHGTWMPDEEGDEPDGRDEALCPWDISRRGPLLDDTLHDIFAERATGARIVFISDSCHSGSVAKFAPAFGAKRQRVRFLPPETFLTDARVKARARAAASLPTRGRARGTALLLAGCRDIEFSYDAEFDGRPNGAFTFVALRALKQLAPQATYGEWFKAIRAGLPTAEHPQTPQIMATTSQRRWPALEASAKHANKG